MLERVSEEVNSSDCQKTITVGGNSKGDGPDIRRCFQAVREIDYPKKLLKYVFVTPDDGISEKVVLEYFPDGKVFHDKHISMKFAGMNLVVQAWKQIQSVLDTDYFFFVDNDVVVIPRDVFKSFLSIPGWDLITGNILIEGTTQAFDTYAFRGLRGEELARKVPTRLTKIRSQCVAVLMKSEVFKSIEFREPSTYVTSFHKWQLMGYTYLYDPDTTLYHSRNIRGGRRFSELVDSGTWSVAELKSLGYMNNYDLDFYWMSVGAWHRASVRSVLEYVLHRPDANYWKRKFGWAKGRFD
jgi:hypothetical protein